MTYGENTTPHLVEVAAERWPDAQAIVDGDVRLTFAALRHEVARATAAAMAAGVRKGDRVGIWAPNRWEWVIAALGAHGAGGVLVPLNTRYKGDEAAYVLSRSGARLLLTVEGFLGIDYVSLLHGHDTVVERTVVFGTSSWDDYLSAGADAADTEPPVVTDDDLSDVI